MFVLAHDYTSDNDQVSADYFKKYFLPRVKIETSKLMEKMFMISQLTTQLSKNINRTKWWLQNWLFIRFCLFWKELIAADSSKQKALDADSRAIQQIIFTGKIKSPVANTRVIIYYILEQSKETILEFSKGTTKVL